MRSARPGRGAERVTTVSALTILACMMSPIRAPRTPRGRAGPWSKRAARAAFAAALLIASAPWDGRPFFIGAQAQAALTKAQAEALDTYNKALDAFRSVLKE